MLSLQNSRKRLLSSKKLASFPSCRRRTECMQVCFTMADEVPALCLMRQAISPNSLHHHPTWSEIYVHLCSSDLNKVWGISCMMMCYCTVGVPGVNDITNSVPCLILCVIMLWTIIKFVVTPQLLSSVGHEMKVRWRSAFWSMSYLWMQPGHYSFSKTESRRLIIPLVLLGISSVAWGLFPKTHRNARHVLYTWKYSKAWVSVCLYSV